MLFRSRNKEPRLGSTSHALMTLCCFATFPVRPDIPPWDAASQALAASGDCLDTVLEKRMFNLRQSSRENSTLSGS